MSKDTNLIDPEGNTIEKSEIPVLRFGEFKIPFRTVTEKDVTRVQKNEKGQVIGIDAASMAREIVSTRIESRDRFNMVMAVLGKLAGKVPELDEVLTELGVVVTDFDGKKIYECSNTGDSPQ